MGYESSGYGQFQWKSKEINHSKIIDLIHPDLQVVDLNHDGLTVMFTELRLCNCTNEFDTLLEYCNGEFEIKGESDTDLWKLIFKDGEVLKANGYIKYKKPIKTTLKEAL